MTTDNFTTNRTSMEAFENNFTHFWEVAARAQMDGQKLGALETKIANATGEKRREYEAYRDKIKAKREEEISDLFTTLRLLSGSEDEECFIECYEMLKDANEVICVNFAKIAAKNETLANFFA